MPRKRNPKPVDRLGRKGRRWSPEARARNSKKNKAKKPLKFSHSPISGGPGPKRNNFRTRQPVPPPGPGTALAVCPPGVCDYPPLKDTPEELELENFPAPEHVESVQPEPEPEAESETDQDPGEEQEENDNPTVGDDDEEIGALFVGLFKDYIESRPSWMKKDAPGIPDSMYEKIQDRLTKTVERKFGTVKVPPVISLFVNLAAAIGPRVDWKKKKPVVKPEEKKDSIEVPPEDIQHQPEPTPEILPQEPGQEIGDLTDTDP